MRFENIAYSSSLPKANNNNAKVLSLPFIKSSSFPKDSSNEYVVKSLSEVNSLFQPRTFGWLGGDSAVSVVIPSYCLFENHDNAPVSIVWLFGDTFIGSSTGKKRDDNARIIANSIGIMNVRNGYVDRKFQLEMYWSSDSTNGHPREIFSVNTNLSQGISRKFKDRKYQSQVDLIQGLDLVKIWPVAAVSLSSHSTSQTTRNCRGKGPGSLVVIGQVTAEQSKKNDIALLPLAQSMQFYVLSSVIVIVNNPASPPNLWSYNYRALPKDTPSGSFVWMLMVDAAEAYSGDEQDEVVYIFGVWKSSASSSSEINNYKSSFVLVFEEFHQVVGRIKKSQLLSFDFEEGFELLCEGNQWKRLYHDSDDVVVPKRLFVDGVTEGSVHFNKKRRQWQFISLEPPDQEVRMCSSSSASMELSTWTCAYIMKIPAPWNDEEKYITYAAKHHPSLLSEEDDADELVISLVANAAGGLDLLFREEGYAAYSPKFFKLSRNV